MQQLFNLHAAILLCAVLAVLPSCREIRGPYTYSLVMPGEGDISITREELDRAVREGLPAGPGPDAYLAEITVYGYSSGKEIFSYSGSEEKGVSVRQGSGYIETMVRVKKGERTLELFFVRGEGIGRKEMLHDLIQKTRDVLNIPRVPAP
jgi:hypothetical protein